jgi:hypothetical protein
MREHMSGKPNTAYLPIGMEHNGFVDQWLCCVGLDFFAALLPCRNDQKRADRTCTDSATYALICVLVA